MRIKRVTLSNYRGYKQSTTILFNDLTVFVGQNDVGKSTILEALDLFFNDGKGIIKYDKSDINISSATNQYEITVVFSELPDKVIVDSSYQTTLREEYLLNSDNELEVIKRFNGSKCSGVYIHAEHPMNPDCSELHLKKKKELKDIIQNNNIPCSDLRVNAIMRRAIWDYYAGNIQLGTVDIDVNSGDDTKRIWSKLSDCMPVYSLFQADRQNTDGDKEIQDPLKLAVAQFLKDDEIQETLRRVAEQVEERLKEVADRTLEKLREMDASIADSLTPVIPSSESLKWADVFTKSVSITSDDDIPINKRGSGVKRLILLNFFRAEAERRLEQGDGTGIIYAIEEPETSQHFTNQKILVDALISLSQTRNTQVIMTTHSGIIVKKLKYDDLRLISENCNGDKEVIPIQTCLLDNTCILQVGKDKW